MFDLPPVIPVRRDLVIDVIRALCIIEMSLNHVSRGSLVDRLTHRLPWFDGASGFVLMSGLVLGMVQANRIARAGMASATLTVLKRAGLLYVAHVALVMLALSVGSLFPSSLPRFAELGGVGMGTLQVMLLQVNPRFLDILSMYVVLLLAAVAASWLLKHNQLVLLLAAMTAAYGIGERFPQAMTLPRSGGITAFFNLGAWQLLFLSAFIVGWYWQQRELSRLLSSRMSALLATTALLALWAFGHIGPSVLTGAAEAAAFQTLFAKDTIGIGRILMAWIVFGLLYYSLSKLAQRVAAKWLAPMAALGRRSLDCFVILSLVTITMFALSENGWDWKWISDWVAAALALLLMLLWARLRDARQAAKPPRNQALAGARSLSGGARWVRYIWRRNAPQGNW